MLKHFEDAKAYFSFRDISLRVKDLDLKISAGTLRVYLTEATASGLIHDAGRGWYSRLSEPLVLDPKPVAKLIRAVAKAFPLLDFTCWSTAQINPFMHHLLGKNLAFVNTDAEAMDPVWEFMRDAGFDAHLNPRGSAREKFAVREKTVVVRRRVVGAPAEGHFARIEALLVDLLLETQRLGLMDMGEFQAMARTAASAGRISMSDLAAYAANRKQVVTDVFGEDWIN